MTVPSVQWAAPKLTTKANADGSRSVTLAFADPTTGSTISLTTTLTADRHLAFLAHGISIDSAWSDV